MPSTTDDYHHIPNPDHPESGFRLNNKGNVNIVGTTNFGAGVKARLGLLKGSGKSAVYVYLFDTKKYTIEEAQEWLDKHTEVEKTMTGMRLLNKGFQFIMPLMKGYEGDDGFYHIPFAISTIQPDLQGDQMTENALESMLKQIKGLNVDGRQLKGINIDDSHEKGLKSIIGPVTDGWIDESKQLWVDLRVREEWEKTIKDLENSGSYLGGSIYGKATAVLQDDGTGINKIDDVFLMRAALTDTPAAWDTRRTASDVSKNCPMCTQIMKSLQLDDLEVKNVTDVTRNEDSSYEALSSKIRAAINSKFSTENRNPFNVRRTWPDAVIAESWDDDKLYEIPYTINIDGNVELGEPKEQSVAYVEKMTQFYSNMIKDIGDDKLTDKDKSIPEGMDKDFVQKIKDAGEDGKEFIKGLLGIDSDPDPDTEAATNSGTSNDDILKRLDTLEQNDYKKDKVIKTLKKDISDKDDLIKSQGDTIKTLTDKDTDKEHKGLVKHALDLTKTIDEETEIKDETGLMKSLELGENEEDDSKFTKEEIESDPDAVLKTHIRALKIASKHIPASKLPNTNDTTLNTIKTADEKKMKDLEKSIENMGKTDVEVEE